MSLQNLKRLPLLFTLISFFAFAAPKKTIKIALNWKPEPQFGGFYAGLEKKIFEKHGFDVTLIPGGAGAPVPQLLESGNVDLGVVTGDEIVVGRARGLSLKALFAVYQDFPQGIMIHAERKISTFEQLFASPGQLALQKGVAYALFLEKKYGKNAKVKIVPYVGGIGPFEKDRQYSQQCFITSEPLAAQKRGLKVTVLPVSEAGYNPYTTVVVAKDAWIASNKAVLKNLYLALQESWDVYLKDPTSTNALMNKLNPGMDLETFAKSAEVQKGLILTSDSKKSGLGVMNATRWDFLAKQLKDLKIVDKIEGDSKNYFTPIWE